MWRGSGVVRDDGTGLKAGSTTVANQNNIGTDPIVPVAAFMGYNTTAQ